MVDTTLSRTIVERTARAGHMSPLHVRNEDETYFLVAGRVTFFVGAHVVDAEPGDAVLALAGVERAVRAESAGARWLVVTRVRSLARYEDFGRAVSAPVPGGAWPSPDEELTLESIAGANDIEVLGPPGVLPAR